MFTDITSNIHFERTFCFIFYYTYTIFIQIKCKFKVVNYTFGTSHEYLVSELEQKVWWRMKLSYLSIFGFRLLRHTQFGRRKIILLNSYFGMTLHNHQLFCPTICAHLYLPKVFHFNIWMPGGDFHNVYLNCGC